jgi:hypothetical protein
MLKQAHDENNNIICLGDMNKKIAEYVDLNLVNAVLHKACTYNINQCKMSYKLKDTISLTFLQQLTRLRSTYSVISFNLLLISLLLLSGDVEINPGPGGTSNIANKNILSIFL